MSSEITAVEPLVATRRVLGRYRAQEPGPCLVACGSLHGNEPAGVEALRRLCSRLDEAEAPLVRGDFVALAGNLEALRVRRRFVDADLNRHWTEDRLAELERGAPQGAANTLVEDRELLALRREVETAALAARGTVHVVDLHTTSGASPPFATVGDRLANRAFALRLGVPVILGLDEELAGTFLAWIDRLGHVGVGFEGGRHNDPAAVDATEAAVWIALVELGLLSDALLPTAVDHRDRLAGLTPALAPMFEVRYRHPIVGTSRFRMEPGFASFQRVGRGELLATDSRGPIRAPSAGRLLMPLYQEQGEDGFFLIQEHSPGRARLPSRLRRLRRS